MIYRRLASPEVRRNT